ncbi:MAG: hypothetical protein ABW121_08720 [Candidatus Thiodiazotropha sp. 6PLUC7]
MTNKKILAVASAGGHLVQLLRLTPAFIDHKVHWVSTSITQPKEIHVDSYHMVREASMWNKYGLAIMAFQIFWLVIRLRPDVVISTGAAPGYFALVFGKIIGARTIWIDSIANSEELSLAGRKSKLWADYWFTQWPELSNENGPHFIGSVI